MFAPLGRLGGIVDLGLGLRWDAPQFENEVARRAAALSREDVGRGSLVAIAHDGTARFFADLLATWTVGATAVCLDSKLTLSEFKTLIEFTQPAVILVDGNNVATTAEIPVLALADSLADAPVAPALLPNEHAYVLFTSVHTGAPNGGELSFRSV